VTLDFEFIFSLPDLYIAHLLHVEGRSKYFHPEISLLDSSILDSYQY
jgi:hypothetical protein